MTRLQAIELEMAPRLSAHWSAIYLNADLFARIDALYDSAPALGLDAEALRVLERYHLDFVRQGAMLKGDGRARLDDIGQRLATLGTEFSQNVLADEQDFVLPLQRKPDGAACRTLPATRRRPPPRNAALDAPYRRHPVALQRRALPAIRRRPRLARAIVQGLGGARRQ